jgi:predicted anti-sigma-YlaC factor YlaD
MRVASAAVSTGSMRKDESPYLHCDEEVLEEYCLGILNERRTSAVEEHLLVCEECRDALAVQNEFVQCLKAALRVQCAPQELAYFQKSA